ncbi:MAG: hypothetical protein GKR89_23770 [Candidatus Latescibacteria bacterium]|nr:hypothetical protein [Candidatus Latescibacterota bacterium]
MAHDTVAQHRRKGHGPAIWLAGDPDDLEELMPLGPAGIVTNTVVLNQLMPKYGTVIKLIERYLAITDKPVVVEIDGHTTQELLEVGRVFTAMSDNIILKIPCTLTGLGAFRTLQDEGIETFCTTVFSLSQAAVVAQAGVDHILPFCEPVKEMGGDATKLVRECAAMFGGWEQRPYIMAALVRSVETAYAALRDGADEIVTFWPVYKDMMQHPLTDTWNETFMNEWVAMHQAGQLEGVPVKLD